MINLLEPKLMFRMIGQQLPQVLLGYNWSTFLGSDFNHKWQIYYIVAQYHEIIALPNLELRVRFPQDSLIPTEINLYLTVVVLKHNCTTTNLARNGFLVRRKGKQITIIQQRQRINSIEEIQNFDLQP